MKPFLDSSFRKISKKVKQLNFYAEIMEKVGIEVDIKIRYLVLKSVINSIFKFNFHTLSKTEKNVKPYLESCRAGLAVCLSVSY